MGWRMNGRGTCRGAGNEGGSADGDTVVPRAVDGQLWRPHLHHEFGRVVELCDSITPTRRPGIFAFPLPSRDRCDFPSLRPSLIPSFL